MKDEDMRSYLDENRRFMDAMLERHVRITEAMIAAMQAGFSDLQAEIADQREQIRANTQAMLRVIDRMDRLDGGADPA